METIEDIKLIIDATGPHDIFGTKKSTHTAKIYKRLLKASHPDMFTKPEDKILAQNAFIKLAKMWEEFNGKKKKENVITTRKHEYTITNPLGNYDGFSLYEATYDAGHKKAVLSFPINSADNDLAENSATALRKLNKDIPDIFKLFYPQYMETFRFTINSALRNFTACSKQENFYSLAQVKEDYPEGIPAKDIAWIFRRLLTAIGNANDIGIVHAGINLNAVLINPENHDLILQDWQYSIEESDVVSAIPLSSKDFYPQYVLDKEPSYKELDIYLAAKTMEALLDDKAPRQLKSFLKGCQLKSLPPAANILGEFDELLKNMWGPRQFHVFKMRRTA